MPGLPRWSIAWIAILALLLSCDRNEEPRPVAGAGRGTNVILIGVDTLRPDHLGVYGYERPTSPNIDDYFSDKTVFRSAYSSAPCTVPSVKQTLYGRIDAPSYPRWLRTLAFYTGISLTDFYERDSLAEILAGQGYDTAAFVSQSNFYRDTLDIYSNGFAHFDVQDRKNVDHHNMTARVANVISDNALAWLEARDEGEKFFLWLHYFDPHDPYEPPATYRGFDEGNTSKRNGDHRLHLMTEPEPDKRGPDGGYIYDPQDVSHMVNLYDGEILYADFQIGRVLSYLKKDGLLDEAIVILVSDHGELLGEDDWWGHCQGLSDEEIRVPLLISDRGGRMAGLGENSLPASTLDILPTILSLTEIPYDEADYHGTSLSRADADRAVVARWDDHQIIRIAGWQLSMREEGGATLNRVIDDRRDDANLLDKHSEVAAQMKGRLESALDSKRVTTNTDQETIDMLRSIGYIE